MGKLYLFWLYVIEKRGVHYAKHDQLIPLENAKEQADEEWKKLSEKQKKPYQNAVVMWKGSTEESAWTTLKEKMNVVEAAMLDGTNIEHARNAFLQAMEKVEFLISKNPADQLTIGPNEEKIISPSDILGWKLSINKISFHDILTRIDAILSKMEQQDLKIVKMTEGMDVE